MVRRVCRSCETEDIVGMGRAAEARPGQLHQPRPQEEPRKRDAMGRG